MARDEHVLAIAQPVFSTFTEPTNAYAVRSASQEMAKDFIEERLTGTSRALRNNYEGVKKGTSSIEMLFFPEEMGTWLEAAGLVSVSTVLDATIAYEHNWLMDASWSYLSLQMKRNATIATNLRDCVVNSITFSFVPNQNVVFTIELLVGDEAPVDGTFEDGDASASIVATPVYIAGTLVPFGWSHVSAITIGGTPALNGSTKEITVAAGTAIANCESLEITLANNGEHKHYLTGDAGAGRMALRDFDVSATLDVDHDTLVTTYYDYVRNGTSPALRVECAGVEADTGFNYELEITIPALSLNEGDYPDIMGTQDDRVQAITGIGVEDTVTGEVLGIKIQDLQTSY